MIYVLNDARQELWAIQLQNDNLLSVLAFAYPFAIWHGHEGDVPVVCVDVSACPRSGQADKLIAGPGDWILKGQSGFRWVLPAHAFEVMFPVLVEIDAPPPAAACRHRRRIELEEA